MLTKKYNVKTQNMLSNYIEDYSIIYVFFKGHKAKVKFFKLFNNRYYSSSEHHIVFSVDFNTYETICHNLIAAVAKELSLSEKLIRPDSPLLSITAYDGYYFSSYTYDKILLLTLDIGTQLHYVAQVIDDRNIIYNTLSCISLRLCHVAESVGDAFINEQSLLLKPLLHLCGTNPKDLIKKALRDVKSTFLLANQDELYKMLVANLSKKDSKINTDLVKYNMTYNAKSEMANNTFIINIGRLAIKIKALSFTFINFLDIKTTNILSINLANFFTHVFAPISIYDVNAVFDDCLTFSVNVDWLLRNAENISYSNELLYNNLEVRVRFDNVDIKINHRALKWLISSRMIYYLTAIQKYFIKEIERLRVRSMALMLIFPTVSI